MEESTDLNSIVHSQKFIGNSRSGMNALETRVQGIEMALEEISIDLGLSSGRFPNGDSSDSKCCRLPGADFLSSKLWRKAEGRYSSLRLSSQGSIQTGNEAFNLGGERFQRRKTDAFTEKREVGDYSGRSLRVHRDGDRVPFISSSGLNGTSHAASLAFGSLTSRYLSFLLLVHFSMKFCKILLLLMFSCLRFPFRCPI